MGIVLEAKGLTKSYQSGKQKIKVLKNIDAVFEEGLFYAITGRSGSGKSTLLHILSGLEKPDTGSILMKGKKLESYCSQEMAEFRRRHMGFIFQQFNLLEEYDVKTNICMPLKLDRKREDSNFFKEITEHLGIDKILKKYPDELSGGEQQRVAIARSLIAKPEILFADEPTGNLDKKTADETLELLLECSYRYGQTLILVTHDMEIAERADEILKIEDGRICETQFQ
ncbi:MAG: ABC transporter ATP-binding protein [Blautia sp.]|nr:ABC transporter ATP-binding protein [Eubacteriales bacterium]MED9966895.1 ABC transporter ATP-binding protein [Blautia sp.]